MRRFLVFAAMLLLFFSLNLFAQVSEEQLRDWRKGLAYINHDSETYGSGWFASKDGIVVCTAHIFNEWEIFKTEFPIYVVNYKREIFKAELIWIHRGWDVLILKIDYKPEVWFDEFETPRLFQRCIVLGYPKHWIGVAEARISFHFVRDALGNTWRPDAGASGSVILSEEGKVLGMLTGGMGYSVMVPAAVIENALAIAKRQSQRG